MTDFDAELDELIKKVAEEATDATIQWHMKDELSFLGFSPQFQRDGDFEGGWRLGDIATGWYVLYDSPSTGNNPGAPWWGSIQIAEGDQDAPREIYDSYVAGLESYVAKWRNLPDPAVIAAEADAILEKSARHINVNFDFVIAHPLLNGWLLETEPSDEVSGSAFETFYDRYKATRTVLTHNLLKNVIDVAACRAADAAAIKTAQNGALSLLEATRQAMHGAHPDEGVTSADAFWNTLGIVADIVPAKGAAETVLKGVKVAQGQNAANAGPGRSITGERPLEVYEDFVEAESEFQSDYEAGVAEIEAEAQAIVERTDDELFSSLPHPDPSGGSQRVEVTRRKIFAMADAMRDIEQTTYDASAQITFNEDAIGRAGLQSPYPEIRVARARVIDRLLEIAGDLATGADNLEYAWKEYRRADEWSDEAIDAIQGRLTETMSV